MHIGECSPTGCAEGTAPESDHREAQLCASCGSTPLGPNDKDGMCGRCYFESVGHEIHTAGEIREGIGVDTLGHEDESGPLFRPDHIQLKAGGVGEIFLGGEELTESKQENATPDPMHNQVCGEHYLGFAIQPLEFCEKNNLNACASHAIGYICRDKDGADDIRKAIDCLRKLLWLKYGVLEHEEAQP